MIAEDEPIQMADEWKEKGNLLFKTNNFREAAGLYSKAIELQPEVATYYSNRAAAYLNNTQYKLALQDCLTALKLDPLMVKAFFRAAKCQSHLGNLEDAQSQLLHLNIALEKSSLNAKTKQAHLLAAANEVSTLKKLQQKV